jgi:hypothetical protein
MERRVSLIDIRRRVDVVVLCDRRWCDGFLKSAANASDALWLVSETSLDSVSSNDRCESSRVDVASIGVRCKRPRR